MCEVKGLDKTSGSPFNVCIIWGFDRIMNPFMSAIQSNKTETSCKNHLWASNQAYFQGSGLQRLNWPATFTGLSLTLSVQMCKTEVEEVLRSFIDYSFVSCKWAADYQIVLDKYRKCTHVLFLASPRNHWHNQQRCSGLCESNKTCNMNARVRIQK